MTTPRRLRLCFVIQRYGLEVAGGSETHCRWIAERLAARHDVRIATTTALDYLEWRNHYPRGRAEVNGLRVDRFPVQRTRSERRFALVQDLVFHEDHTLADEREWVRENGPESPELVAALPGMADVDLFVFYSYRYYQSFFGLPPVKDRAVLVPTAEEDPAIELPIFRSLFRAPRGIVYLTPEEKSLVQGVSANTEVPDVIVGSGINVPPAWAEAEVRVKFALPERYLLYVGRIDRNKGVDKLFRDYRRLVEGWPDAPLLAVVGKPALPIPEHPKIRHLGYVSEEEKFALLAGCEVLLMPSRYESLSMIVLEAWAMGRPVLANAECHVLEGQCVRSGGGLFYRGPAEFGEALRYLCARPDLQATLGKAGQAYVRREYDWSVVESRTESFLQSLA
jgi:glycosyltransferase involved in cell wall biosynthesis